MRALPELEGRLEETLPVRPLVPAVGLLLEGRLPTVGLLVLVRPELLPTRPEPAPAPFEIVGRLDMLPPLLRLWRPSLDKEWLIEPAVPLPWRTLAT